MTTENGSPPRTPVVAMVSTGGIDFHPLNIRTDLGDLRDLADSIREWGVIEPLIAERHGGRLRLRAGHRRLAAARIAGVGRVPVVIHAQALNDRAWLIHAVHENTRRRDLDARDRVRAARALKDAGVPVTEIAAAMKVSGARVYQLLAGDLEATPDPAAAAADVKPTALSDESPARNAGHRAMPGYTRPAAPPPQRRPPAMVGKRRLREFVEEWRARPAATVQEVLDAVAALADVDPLSQAPPLSVRL